MHYSKVLILSANNLKHVSKYLHRYGTGTYCLGDLKETVFASEILSREYTRTLNHSADISGTVLFDDIGKYRRYLPRFRTYLPTTDSVLRDASRKYNNHLRKN